jgi:phospholipid transport system substrate-binding protein
VITIAKPLRVIAAVMVLVATGSVAISAETPSAVIQQTADTVVAILADQSLTADQKRHKIEDVADQHFDFVTLSRLVLARNWKELSPGQQQAFVAEFKKHLSLTYGKNVETYNNERAEITGERPESQGDVTVKSKIVRPNAEPILVDYRLRKGAKGDWKVIDVIIEGVSLVANFRSQFQEVISNQGAVKLIDLLREKNAKGEPLKAS